MENAPLDQHATDAIERRPIRPALPVTAVIMAAVLASMLGLIAARVAFTDVEASEIIDNVIVGIVIPLVAAASMWHQSSLHRERQAAEERLIARLAQIEKTLSGVYVVPQVATDLRALERVVASLRSEHEELRDRVARSIVDRLHAVNGKASRQLPWREDQTS